MEFLKLIEMFSQFGLAGVILIIWYKSDRSRERALQKYREDMTTVLHQHEGYMQEMRRMYEDNVKLVHGYEMLATDLKDVVLLNTQSVTHLGEAISHNQFCPMVRLEKRAKGKQEE